ncbi:MAG: PaaI family thioesterase [Halanaerobiales bacterium]
MKLDGADMCFACGKDNPISLGLEFELVDDSTAETTFIPSPEHQGYNGMMHGGLVSTLLDEAMAKVLELNEIPAVTAELKTRFKEPVKIGEKLLITGKITDNYKKLYYTEAELKNKKGKILATAEAKFMQAEAKN